jgi:hypothetical protein
VAPNKLTTGANTNDATSYTTATITPGADRLAVAFVLNATFFQAAPIPAVSGNGLNWYLVDSVEMGDRRLSCFVGRGATPSAGPVGIACGNVTQTLCAWSIFEYDAAPGNAMSAIGLHETEEARNVAGLSIGPNPGLGPNEVAVGGVMLDVSRTVAAGAGCSQIDVQAPSQPIPPSAATLHTEDRTTPGDVGWAWKDNANAAAIVLTVKLPAAGGPQPFDPLESIVRQFEPILFFDAAEASFPSDAKRYLEHCALWRATATPFNNQQSWPIDDQHSWQKLVPAGQLSAAEGEPGKFIGDAVNTVDTPSEERFLELGGWLDMTDGKPRATVPDPGVLRYANRAEIRARYATVPALRDSQFWYHAELFDTTRLTSLAESVQTPNLYRLVASLRNPTLLCYYLFFPEHEQAVVANNWEAKEVGSYAGQWASVTLLLERTNDQDPYTEPSYIGFTGTPTITPTPQASDPEQRITLKLAPWRSLPFEPRAEGLPRKTDGHPHLYISPGTHSIYLDNTAHEVAPFPSAPPYNGGLWDGAPTHGVDNDDLSVFWLKLKGAALIAAGIEALFLDFGTHPEVFGAADPIPQDAATAPGGVTIHPASVVPRNEWTQPQAWRSAQMSANGRQYDHIVNRSAQRWWPSNDHTSGFRGRWGQRVERDWLPRRSGVRFPEFWRLFLLAYEDGRQRGLIPKK